MITASVMKELRIYTLSQTQKFTPKLILGKVNDLHLYLKCHSSTCVFKHFASKNQLPRLAVNGTWSKMG